MKKELYLRIVSLPAPLKATYQDAKRIKHSHSGQSLAVNNSGTTVILVAPDEQVWLWRIQITKTFPKTSGSKSDFASLASSTSGIDNQGSWQLLTDVTPTLHVAVSNEEISAPSSSSFVSSQSSSSGSYSEPNNASAVSYSFSSSPDDGKFACILRVWLRPVNEGLTFIDYDYLQVTLDHADRGGQKISKAGRVKHLKHRGKLDFKSREEAVVLLSLDHSGYLAAVAVNSSYLFMCQLLFLAPNEQRVTSRRLAQYITKDDMPPCNEDGHTDMWVQGMAWTADDFYVVLALRSNCICIFTRLGEPVYSQIEMTSSLSDPRIFSHLFFSTEPSRFGRYPKKLGCVFKGSQLLVWDGLTVNFLEVLSLRTLRELAPMYLPHEAEGLDLSINISHDTNPLPSEMDSGPKRHSIDKALVLLRCSLNLRVNPNEGVVFEAATAWLEAVLPPALHEEINYTINQSMIDLSESRINSNLVLKRKVRSCDVLRQFDQVLEMLKWRAMPAVEYKEWTLMIAESVIKYLLADGQAFYAYNALARAEKSLEVKLHKLRMLVVAHSLLQYKNCQANQLNVLFFALAFVTLHGKQPSLQPLLNLRECSFLRRALRDALENAPADTEPEEMQHQESYELPLTPELHFIKPVREFVETSFKYLMDRPCVYESFGERLCQLLITQDSQADSFISSESLFLVAFYLDPLVPNFLSPVEFVSLELHKCLSVQELYAKLVKLATVPVPKTRNTSKEAAFLYWSIGLPERVVELLEPNLAFVALVSALHDTTESESRVICRYLLELQPKVTPLMPFELVPEYLRALFQVGELRRVKTKLIGLIDLIGAEQPNLEDLMTLAARALRGTYVGAKKLANKTWLHLEIPTTDDSRFVHATLLKEGQNVLRYLWYFHIQAQLSQSSRKLPWLLRLLEFSDVHRKSSLYSQVLNALWEVETADLELLSVYLLETDFPRTFDARLSRWKAGLSQRSPELFAQAGHAMRQKQGLTSDFSFLDYCETVYRAYRHKGNWAAVKQWKEIEARYRAAYKLDSRLLLADGCFVTREAESWDFTYLFNDFKPAETLSPLEEAPRPSKSHCVEAEMLPTLRNQAQSASADQALDTSLARSSAGLRTASPIRLFKHDLPLPFSLKLSCDRLISALTAYAKRTLSLVYTKEKQQPVQRTKPGHRRQMSSPAQSSPYQIISVKPTKVSTERIKPAKQLNVEFTSVTVQHRRTKSAMDRHEKPFQLLRVKSKAAS
jgi:hypothetical protein